MIIKTPRKSLPLDAPILHEDHKRPVTRREFLGAGMIAGSAAVWTPNLMGLLLPRSAYAAPTDLECGVGSATGGAVPFMAFDLGGGANMAGSNVLVGAQDGDQLATLSAAGYSKLGIPGGQTPDASTGNNVDTSFGLAFHGDSAFLRGMLSRTSAAARANVNGVVIPARSDNDTGNNPHNPMYLIARARLQQGFTAELMELIGTNNSDSGGRSIAGTLFMDTQLRPTKISSRLDSSGLVETGGLKDQLQLSTAEISTIMDSITRLSNDKVDKSILAAVRPTENKIVNCAYNKAAYTVANFGPADFDPLEDPRISSLATPDGVSPVLTTRPGGYASNQTAKANIGALADTDEIFTENEIRNSDAFRKTSAVMQMVVNNNAGAATIALGGYDYHDSSRATGERRDFNAGAAIGGAIEYAHRKQQKLMIYVFTDGSLASNGDIDNSPDGRGKGVWTGDNSSTSAAFMLVYNPGGPFTVKSPQLGHFRTSGSVETNNTTRGANNPQLLAQMVALNYVALSSGNPGSDFDTYFTDAASGMKHGLGTNLDPMIGFNQIP